MKQIDKLIINSPYEEPKCYWHYDREHRSFEKLEGRRPAGYVVATPDSRGFDDPGVFVPIELVNKIPSNMNKEPLELSLHQTPKASRLRRR